MTFLQIHTQEELDTAAQALAESWGKSFAPGPKFDGKKKNALRDVVLRLAGYPNGYQQWKTHQEMARFTAQVAMAEHATSINEWTERVKELPSTLLVVADAHSVSDLLLVGDKHPDHERALGLVRFQMSHERYPESDLWQSSVPLNQVPLWLALTARYVVTTIEIEMPSIEEYGIPDVATDDGAIDFVEDLGLSLPEDRYVEIFPHDRMDDGSAQVFITLTAIN